MEENTDNQPVLHFFTSGDWWANDLALVLDSLDQLYNVLALSRHLGIIEEKYLARSLRDAEENWVRFQKMGPELDIFLHEWARYLRRAGPEAARFLPGLGLGVPTLPAVSLSDTERECASYLNDPATFRSQKHRLSIVRIEMGSPGGFSLKGLGEPIRQLRELIKDLCYRNRQKEQMGELELLREKLAIASNHNLSPQQIYVLATKTMEHQQYIEDVISEGWLALEGKESDATNTDSLQKRRRPRRKRKS